MTKLPASWKPDQPGTVTVGTTDTRITTTATRTTVTGDTRVTSGITVTPKESTSWS